MANLFDVFTQTSNLKQSGETTILSTAEDLPKDKPSLFDSLLKTTIENIENSTKDSTKELVQTKTAVLQSDLELSSSEIKVLEDSSLIENILDVDAKENKDLENINLDENTKIEKATKDSKNIVQNNINGNNSKNSLLDRLVLEVKSNNLDRSNQSEQVLSEPLKYIENSQTASENINFVESLDEVIDELKNQNIVEEKEINSKVVVSQGDKVVEIVQKETILKDVNTNTIKTESLQNEVKEILDTTKIDTNAPQDTENQDITSQNKNSQILTQTSSLINTQEDLSSNNIKEVNSKIIKSDDSNKIEQKLTLMDQLIQSNSAKDITKKIEESTTSANIEQTTKNSKEISSNIFLADQKNTINNQLLFNKNEAIKVLQTASGIEDIQKSANILDLDASNLEVEQDIVKEDFKNLSINEKEVLDRKNILNNLLREKDIRSIDVRNLITNSIQASKALLEDTINIADDKFLDIQPNLVNSFQSRIIGAKQSLANMMSDVAKQMYENYKPPVTVFRMHLNPGDLGSISIMMKQDKSSGLTINMSVSNIATLELLMENQNMLRNSLIKTFNDNGSFNLDFSQGQDGSREGSSSSNQNKKGNKESNTQEILRMQDENRDLEEKNDYM